MFPRIENGKVLQTVGSRFVGRSFWWRHRTTSIGDCGFLLTVALKILSAWVRLFPAMHLEACCWLRGYGFSRPCGQNRGRHTANDIGRHSDAQDSRFNICKPWPGNAINIKRNCVMVFGRPEFRSSGNQPECLGHDSFSSYNNQRGLSCHPKKINQQTSESLKKIEGRPYHLTIMREGLPDAIWTITWRENTVITCSYME